MEILNQNFKGKPLEYTNLFIEHLLLSSNGVMSNIYKISKRDICNRFFKNQKNTMEKCLKKLLELGIVECDDDYIRNNRPLGYRISNNYLPSNKQSTTKLLKKEEKTMSIKTIIEEEDFFNAPVGPEGFDQLTNNLDTIEVVAEPVTTKQVKYKHKGIGEEMELTITKDDMQLFKKAKQEIIDCFGGAFEDGVIKECVKLGVDKFVANYLWIKFNNKI